MSATRLVQRRLLDPRPAGEAAQRPVADSVSIPFAELPQRTHELPPHHRTIHVAGPTTLVQEVVTWLRNNDRRAVAVPDFRHSDAAGSNAVGRLWEPNGFLAEILPQLPPGTALDLACGTGRDAAFMSSCGWEVTAIDTLPDALARARDLARHCAGALRPIRWIEADIEAAEFTVTQQYDLITVFRFLHRPLLERLPDWLAPGGSVLCETFTTAHRRRYGKPTRDAFTLKPGELPALLSSLQIRHHSEAWREYGHTGRIWGTKPEQPTS
ncbi:methyltransferase domain-containing protein [bacterium]|nr:methyltransferase domain-containing protein [bacterium]